MLLHMTYTMYVADAVNQSDQTCIRLVAIYGCALLYNLVVTWYVVCLALGSVGPHLVLVANHPTSKPDTSY